MAGVTLIGAINMIGAFTTGNGTVMTADTGTDDFGMIDVTIGDRRPGRRARQMTGVAQVAGINMIGPFTAGDSTVMTTGTGAIDLGMVHGGYRHRCPGGREFLMAGITHIAGIDMGRAFATGGNPVMTTDTVIDKRCVIHGGRYPRRHAVAIIAFLGGDNVGG